MGSIMTMFFITIGAGIPVAFALGLTAIFYLITHAYPVQTLASVTFASLISPNLMAIPFFILAAEILNGIGATKKLIDVFDAFFGHTGGGLPLVAVMATAFFAAICGSSVATAAAIGSVMIPDMIKRGYKPVFAVGLIASAGGLGILIPPSVPFVVYGMVTEQSIASLFLGGMVFGIGLATCLGVATWILSVRSGVARRPKQSWEQRKQTLKEGWSVLLMPVLVLGGLYGGFFTPMEAAAFGCVYGLLLTISYRVSITVLMPLLTKAASSATVILMILACSQLFGFVLTAERIPHALFQYIINLGLSKNEFLLLSMLFFILAGMFLEVNSIIIITMPILLPLVNHFGIDPVHFGVMVILNMELAVITPPIGLNLFVISAFSGIPVLSVFRGTIPFALIILAYLTFIVFTPGIENIVKMLRVLVG